MLVRRPVKIALTMEEQFYMITSTRRRSASKAASIKPGGVVAAILPVYWNGAPMPISARG